MVKHDIPWISYGWSHASFAEIKRLTRPSLAFMGFPIGQCAESAGVADGGELCAGAGGGGGV